MTSKCFCARESAKIYGNQNPFIPTLELSQPRRRMITFGDSCVAPQAEGPNTPPSAMIFGSAAARIVSRCSFVFPSFRVRMRISVVGAVTEALGLWLKSMWYSLCSPLIAGLRPRISGYPGRLTSALWCSNVSQTVTDSSCDIEQREIDSDVLKLSPLTYEDASGLLFFGKSCIDAIFYSSVSSILDVEFFKRLPQASVHSGEEFSGHLQGSNGVCSKSVRCWERYNFVGWHCNKMCELVGSE